MTMYNIINCMSTRGKDFSAMCVFASAISNAIYVAKGEQMPKSEFTWEQRNRRFQEYVGDLSTMQRMWNATRPENYWDYNDLVKLERLLHKIWWKYNK